jgi:hypothetical protein
MVFLGMQARLVSTFSLLEIQGGERHYQRIKTFSEKEEYINKKPVLKTPGSFVGAVPRR